MKAVVFVDVQNDFIDGALKNEDAQKVVPKIVEFAKNCLDSDDYEIYATRDTHEKTLYKTNKNDVIDPGGTLHPVSGYFATLEGQRLQKEHCIEGTDGWMVDNRLLDALQIGWDGEEQPVFGCTFVNKPSFGSEDLLKIIAEDNEKWHFDEIILCGFCTGICVLANAVALRMKFPNMKITVIKDLCACVTPQSHANALEVMKLQQIDIA